MQQQVDGKTTSFRQRPYISDRELVEQLLKLEREMELAEREQQSSKVAS